MCLIKMQIVYIHTLTHTHIYILMTPIAKEGLLSSISFPSQNTTNVLKKTLP